jgi:cytochrome P450
MPLGMGNHICPGQHLAHAELRVFILRLLNKFSIETVFPKVQTQQKGFFTLRATAAQIKLI